MLKILQARLQQYINWELSDVEPGFRKGRGTRNQIANIHGIIEKARKFHKNMYFSFIDYTQTFDCKITKNCRKFLKGWKYQTTLPASWETCMWVKKQQLELDWLKIVKGVRQGCISSPCLFNLYAEYIMWNDSLGETQAWIKIARRNINNLRCADHTTLMGRKWRGTKKFLDESERGEWKSWLETKHSKT